MHAADENGQYRAPAAGDLSVVVCADALDRWGHLRKTLRALTDQREPVGEIVLVVDRNDHVLSAARTVFPDLSVIPNGAAPGLAGARDTGLAHCSGQIVAFLDDDAVVTPDWSQWITAAYDSPEVIAAGGRIGRQRPRPASSWWPPEVGGVTACSHRGLPLNRGVVRALTGANLSLRAAAVQEVTQDGRPTGLCVRAQRRTANVPGGSTWQYLVGECHGARGSENRRLPGALVGAAALVGVRR